MLRIIFLIFFISPPSFGTILINLKVGVPDSMKAKSFHYKKLRNDISVINYDYNLKLMNDYVSGALDVVVLPEEYVLMAIGTSYFNEVIARFGKHKYYLVMPVGIKKNSERKILLRENSLEDYYFRKFSGSQNYKVVYANSYEIQESIKNGFSFKNEKIDGVVLSEQNYLHNKSSTKLKAIPFEGGQNYALALSQDNWFLNDETVSKILRDKGIKFQKIEQVDMVKLNELSHFLHKKKNAESLFKSMSESLIQDLK